MTEPELQYGSVYFFICLFNSFEQVPVPGVTENRYLAYAERWEWLCEGRNLVPGGYIDVRYGVLEYEVLCERMVI